MKIAYHLSGGRDTLEIHLVVLHRTVNPMLSPAAKFLTASRAASVLSNLSKSKTLPVSVLLILTTNESSYTLLRSYASHTDKGPLWPSLVT